LRLRELEMRFRVAWVELKGAPIINQSLRIFPLVITRITFRKEFLGITVAADTENQQKKEQRARDSCGAPQAAVCKIVVESTGFHIRLEKQFCTTIRQVTSAILSQCQI
jgi:hypothetical protein